MYYSEYAIAAQTHYKSCKLMYDRCVVDNQLNINQYKDILYRILYLCGHVIECSSIYLIFKYFRFEDNPSIPDWNGSTSHIHIKYNKRFTIDSHLDFYPIKVEKGQIYSLKRKKLDGNNVSFGRVLQGEQSSDFYNIQSHNFNGYIKNIIHTQLPQNVPFLRQFCPEDNEYKNAIYLMETWNTDLRYYYEGRQSGHYIGKNHSQQLLPVVDSQTIDELLRMCGMIVGLLPSGRQL